MTEPNYTSDLLAWEVHGRYCREEAVIRNALGATVTLETVLGQPLNYVSTGVYALITAAQAATPANVDAICIDTKGITGLADDTNTTEKFSVLVRGPAIVVGDLFAEKDATGYDFDDAEISLGLMDKNIVTTNHPSVTGRQTY